MADVPSAAKRFLTIAGDKIFGCYRILGDASGDTWTAPVTAIESAWFQRIDDDATDEKMSWTGAVITLPAPGAGLYIDIFFIGY